MFHWPFNNPYQYKYSKYTNVIFNLISYSLIYNFKSEKCIYVILHYHKMYYTNTIFNKENIFIGNLYLT